MCYVESDDSDADFGDGESDEMDSDVEQPQEVRILRLSTQLRELGLSELSIELTPCLFCRRQRARGVERSLTPRRRARAQSKRVARKRRRAAKQRRRDNHD